MAVSNALLGMIGLADFVSHAPMIHKPVLYKETISGPSRRGYLDCTFMADTPDS